MKQVVIGMKDGKPYVMKGCTKVEVIFRLEKRRSFRKVFRTLVYRVKVALGKSS